MIDDDFPDVREYRRELMKRIEVDGPCPACGKGHVTYKNATSDFPGYAHRMLLCPECGITVQWEEQLDDAGRREVAVVVAVTYVHDAPQGVFWG